MFSDNVHVSQSPIQRCLYLHAHSELFHDADHDQCCARLVWSITLSRSVLFDKNIVNQVRQCDQILENGPTRYIEQGKAQLLTESPATKSMNSVRTRKTAMIGARVCTRQVQR